MTEEQADSLIEILVKQNQLLESIDWKLWELMKHVMPQFDKADDEE